ncbi:hypothetical protein OH77DRAFT_1423300 [Trametes cingulata]|nr:hypothetical protein OH77DRAFT_1423300 [Trametes cingulata]
MRATTLLAIIGCLASAMATPSATFPTCAVPCLVNGDFGSCDPIDDACLCNDQAFLDGLNECLAASCSASDFEAAEEAIKQICAAVGATVAPRSNLAAGTPAA